MKHDLGEVTTSLPRLPHQFLAAKDNVDGVKVNGRNFPEGESLKLPRRADGHDVISWRERDKQ